MKVAVVWARTDPDMIIWRALLLLYAQWALESAMFGRLSEKFRIFLQALPVKVCVSSMSTVPCANPTLAPGIR